MPERTYLLTVGIIALIFILHSIDDNSFCLDTDRPVLRVTLDGKR
jgi:hypothetical protein